MKPQCSVFRARAVSALEDPFLQKALKRATTSFLASRTTTVARMSNWEELRSIAHEVKEHTIQNLDVYLEEFSSNAKREGAHIFWARTGADACRYVVDLANEKGISRIVKSKSMLTDEVSLNEALEKAGFEVTETDLGEYIIQLLGDSPSHLVAPAIHKSRTEIAHLFADRLGIPFTEKVPELTQAARNVLRKKFFEAGMGISGVNLGIAETGTIVIVENEGNARLTTTLPSVHVAIMGLERLIPRLADLDLFLKLLVRSATGQKLSSYVSLITGSKKRPVDQGPEELHLILVDNGRSKILADPVHREALYCLRCGACLNICPVYQKIGGHAYGWVYPGPIGAVITPLLVGLEEAGDLPFASSLCGACKEICPVKIDIPRLLLNLRGRVKEVGQDSIGRRPFSENLAMKTLAVAARNPRLYTFVSRILRLVQKPLVRQGYFVVKKLPVLGAWTRSRDFPALSTRTFTDLWKRNLRNVK